MVTGLGFRVRVRVSACCDCLTESPLTSTCDNVHLIVTLDVNVGPVTLWTRPVTGLASGKAVYEYSCPS